MQKYQKYFESTEASYKIIKLFEPMMRFIVELKDEIYNKCNKRRF